MGRRRGLLREEQPWEIWGRAFRERGLARLQALRREEPGAAEA